MKDDSFLWYELGYLFIVGDVFLLLALLYFVGFHPASSYMVGWGIGSVFGVLFHYWRFKQRRKDTSLYD